MCAISIYQKMETIKNRRGTQGMAKQLKAMTTIPGYRDVTSSSNMMAHNQLLIPDTRDLILSL